MAASKPRVGPGSLDELAGMDLEALGLAYLRMKDGDHLGCFFGITRGSE
jgi:hypothetical protein